MVRLSVVADVAKVRAELSSLPRQVKFAVASAVTALAKQAVEDLKTAMKKDFDRPTAYSLGAFTIKAAKKDFPTAYVVSKSGSSRNRPAWRYLRWEAAGGQRVPKGFELKLAALSGNQFVVPTTDTPLDGNGNIQRAWLEQVLVGLALSNNAKAALRQAKLLRKTNLKIAASGSVSPFFIGRAGGPAGRAKGVYQLIGRGEVRMVLAFETKAPSYKVRLDVDGVIRQSVQRHRAAAFTKAIAIAKATARRP